METKHTHGPWKAHLNVPSAAIEGHIIKADYSAFRPIASLFKGGGSKGVPEQIANAFLIAAAPEMLDALQGIKSYVTRLLTLQKVPQMDIDYILRKVDTAIEKATKQKV